MSQVGYPIATRSNSNFLIAFSLNHRSLEPRKVKRFNNYHLVSVSNQSTSRSTRNIAALMFKVTSSAMARCRLWLSPDLT